MSESRLAFDRLVEAVKAGDEGAAMALMDFVQEDCEVRRPWLLEASYRADLHADYVDNVTPDCRCECWASPGGVVFRCHAHS
jgi:hypothetical protein